tara:strand:- start:41 stop:658 length:618 start_codon:yes stop_codon:yes gene_type:complete
MKHLLSSTAFIVLNKELAKQVGINAATLLADLISKEEYFLTNGMSDGWFFNTEANIEKDTTLTPYQQRKCIKTLKDKGLIEVKRKGIPAKQFFKINEEQVINKLNNLSATNLTTINKNKKITIKNKYFKKPTIDEVNNYCLERGNKVDAEAFVNFYESKGWMVGKNKMKDWKSAVVTWEKRETKKTSLGKLHSQINEWQEAKKLL